MELIKNLNWRYATKKFDATKKVSEEHLGLLKEAIRLSVSSFGLQPYKVIIISDKTLLRKLHPYTWGQSQVDEASHLFVFCSQLDITDHQVDEYLELKFKTQGIPLGKLAGYSKHIKEKIKGKSKEAKKNWITKQSFLALGNLLTACAELKIDSCPLEGFDPTYYDEILKLKEKGLTATVLAAIGYRSEEDRNQHLIKVRKSKNTLFEAI